jgi:hypothetical protein
VDNFTRANAGVAIGDRVKVISGLDITQKKIPQRGFFAMNFNDRKIEFDVYDFPTILGEKMVLKESILHREPEFKKRYGIVFREGRIDLIVNRMIEKGYDVNTVSEEVVEVQRQVEEFERDFERRTGIDLQFNEEAINRITEIILNEEGKGTALFSRLSKDYEYGFD